MPFELSSLHHLVQGVGGQAMTSAREAHPAFHSGRLAQSAVASSQKHRPLAAGHPFPARRATWAPAKFPRAGNEASLAAAALVNLPARLGTASTRRCRGVALTSGFGAQRKWKSALARPNTTRMTHNRSEVCVPVIASARAIRLFLP